MEFLDHRFYDDEQYRMALKFIEQSRYHIHFAVEFSARSETCEDAPMSNGSEHGSCALTGPGMSGPNIRVLIVEKHDVIRQGLAELVDIVEGLHVVGEAANGEEAIAQFREAHPDVILIDLRLGAISGVEVVRQLHSEAPEAGVIVLSTFPGEEDISRAIEAGAYDHLLYGMSKDELVSTIARVYARCSGTLVSPNAV